MVEVIVNTLKWVLIFFLLLAAIIFIGKLISGKKEAKREINRKAETVEDGIRRIEQDTDNDIRVDQNGDDIENKQDIMSETTVEVNDTGVEDHLWIAGIIIIVSGITYVMRYQKFEKE